MKGSNKKILIDQQPPDQIVTVMRSMFYQHSKNLNNNIKEILNPYFTTKKQGTGLGLSIVNKIINDHNGNIEFIPNNDGATIKITFTK